MEKGYKGCSMRLVLTIVLLLVALYVFLCLLGWLFFGPHEGQERLPTGLWYCEEHQIQLYLNKYPIYFDDQVVDTGSFICIDGRYVMCGRDPISDDDVLSLEHQDISDETNLNDTLFEGKIMEVHEQNFKVRDENQVTFTFYKVNEFSAEEIQNHHTDQIAQYQGVETAGDVRHVAAVTQAAEELWQTELGKTVGQGDSITVAFDSTATCWLVSTSGQTQLMALIEYDGNVLGVWEDQTA